MPIFSVRKLPNLTKRPINLLEREGKCLWNDFKNEIKADNNLKPELTRLFAIVEDAANNKNPSKSKFKPLKSISKTYTVYEARSTNLRLYVFSENITGVIVVLGGKKTTQDSDLKRMKQLMKEYTNFKNKS